MAMVSKGVAMLISSSELYTVNIGGGDAGVVLVLVSIVYEGKVPSSSKVSKFPVKVLVSASKDGDVSVVPKVIMILVKGVTASVGESFKAVKLEIPDAATGPGVDVKVVDWIVVVMSKMGHVEASVCHNGEGVYAGREDHSVLSNESL